MSGLDGPGTRRRVQRALDGGVSDVHAPLVGRYEYVDAAGRHSPRWTASHVRLRAFRDCWGRGERHPSREAYERERRVARDEADVGPDLGGSPMQIAEAGEHR